jgi:hypothetical protein
MLKFESGGVSLPQCKLRREQEQESGTIFVEVEHDTQATI